MQIDSFVKCRGIIGRAHVQCKTAIALCGCMHHRNFAVGQQRNFCAFYRNPLFVQYAAENRAQTRVLSLPDAIRRVKYQCPGQQ